MRTYTKTHEWIDKEGDVATVGLTQAAVDEIGEIVYVELPQVGKSIQEGSEACVIESTKAAIDIVSPISGQVVAVNTALQDNVNLLNTSCEKDGWLFRIRVSD